MAYEHITSMMLSVALMFVAAPTQSMANEGEAKGTSEAPPSPPKAIRATNFYVHTWIAMPGFTAARLDGENEQETTQPTKGRTMVLVFLASWCEPCQQMMPEMQRLQRHYQKLNTDFIYIFSHDTRDDALGFIKEFNLGKAYLANQSVLKTYHAPELPSIYVGDRHGWLVHRYLKVTAADLGKLDAMLQYLAAY